MNFTGLIKTLVITASLSSFLFITGCNNNKDSLDEQIAELGLEALPETIPDPVDNVSTAEKVALGKLLFWDPILGGEYDMACVTCHHPDLAYADGIDLPIGVRGTGLGPERVEGVGIERVPRNAPSILNSACNGMINATSYVPESAPMFWDTRKESLEEQAVAPPTSESEMAGFAYLEDDAIDSIVIRLQGIPEYVTLFDEIWGLGAASISSDNLGKAISAFERTLVTPYSPYDNYLRGDLSALSDDQKEGLLLFFGKAKCDVCHSGPMLSDWSHHALGVEENPSRPETPDYGKDSVFTFRTPTLRNIEITGPYMHNGMHSTLEEVMVFYNEGVGRSPYVTDISPDFVPLGLTDDEIDKVIAFMYALTDEDFDKEAPTSVPSGLPVGGSID